MIPMGKGSSGGLNILTGRLCKAKGVSERASTRTLLASTFFFVLVWLNETKGEGKASLAKRCTIALPTGAARLDAS